MRVWKGPRAARRLAHHSRSRPVEDAFVDAVHHHPRLALEMLKNDRSLALARAGWGETALQAACHLGQHELIRGLISAGAKQDVFAACAAADIEALNEFLQDTDPTECGIHGLPLSHFAVVSGDTGTVQALIDAGIEMNPAGASLSPLHTAVAIGSIPMIKALMATGVDIGVSDAFGATALDWAYDVEDRGSVLAVLLAAGLRRPAAERRSA